MANVFELLKMISGPKSQPAPAGVEWMICALGNPGKEYRYTRHNAGFLCMSEIAKRLKVNVDCEKFRSLTARTDIEGHRVLLLCPMTYMNLSGEAVRDAADYYHIPPERILVIVDDINLPVGRMRLRMNGSDGGHNGLKSIIYQLNSDAFPRLRIGVGQKPEEYELVNWVLSRFSDDELSRLSPLFSKAADSLGSIVGGRTDEAMRICNNA